ncbi:MAG: hypothetical protein ABFR75_06565 [Acidobacteriota bacterium]
MTSEIMEVKGSVIASIPKFVRKNFGEKGFTNWLSHLSVDAKKIYFSKINDSEWYPLKIALLEPMANISQVFYEWDLKKAAWELGRFSADSSVGTLKKFLFKVGSSVFFLNKAGEFMNGYYRPATIIVKDVREGEGIFRITEFPEIENTVEYRIAGWIERVLEIAGNKDISVEITSSLTKFEPYTEFLVKWK